MKKQVLCFGLILALFITMYPSINAYAASITDANVFVKQDTSVECTLASNVMMLRRKAILDGDSNWANITSATLRKQVWSNKGMAWEFTYSGMDVYSYGLKSELSLNPGDVAKKKEYFINNLKSHPEGIVIYVHYASKWRHAVLLTDYNSSTDTFYCSDPANNVDDGRIKLTASLLPQYIKNSGYNETGLSDQDLVIGYIQQTWMVVSGKSSVKSDLTPSVTVPGVPTNIKVEKAGEKTAKVSWQAGKDADTYEVQYETHTSPAVWKTDPDYKSKAARAYTTSGLGLYDSYRFRVRSVNSAGKSEWVTVTYKKTGTTTEKPSVPTGINVARASDTTAIISWNAVSGATAYEVQYKSPNTKNSWNTDSEYKTKTSTSYTATQLGDNVYGFRVRAVNAEGSSDWAEVSYAHSKTALNTYLITYDANGGSGAPSSHSVNADSNGNATFTLSTKVPTRSGYKFLYWLQENNAGNGYCDPGQTISINYGRGDYTLTYYAFWGAAPETTTPETTTPTQDLPPNLTTYRYRVDWINIVQTSTWEKDGSSKNDSVYTFGCDLFVSSDLRIDEYGIVLLNGNKKQIAASASTDTGSSGLSAKKEFPIHQTTYTTSSKTGNTKTVAQQGILANLTVGDTYYYYAYIICGDKKTELQMQSFVFDLP